MAYNLSRETYPKRLKNKVAAGTGDTVVSDTFDTEGAEKVKFTTILGAITAGGTVTYKLEHGDQSNLSDVGDVEGSAQTITDADDNKMIISDVIRPKKRYMRVSITRGGGQNSEIDAIVGELYGLRKTGPSLDSTVKSMEVLASPATGTP